MNKQKDVAIRKRELYQLIGSSGSWDDIYKKIVPINKIEQNKFGDLFEVFCWGYFKTDRSGSFNKVWLACEVPKNIREELHSHLHQFLTYFPMRLTSAPWVLGLRKYARA